LLDLGYHLSFSSADGGREQVTVLLDLDLASALRGLRPADGDSAATLQHWIPGDETRLLDLGYHLSFSSADGGREQVTVLLDLDLASALRGDSAA
ncbi:unnamed protein product, partial [Polarella glacialis]